MRIVVDRLHPAGPATYRVVVEHRTEVARRWLNKRVVATTATARQKAAYGKMLPKKGPWHSDGLTSFQRECALLMLQHDLGYGRRRRVHGTGDHDEHGSNLWVPLDASSVAAAEFLAAGGWSITKAGTTGTPQGRPRAGLAGDFLVWRLERDLPYTLHELRNCMGKRRRSGELAGMYDHLALWTFATDPNQNAFAVLVGCSKRTVSRLHEKGRALTEQLNRIEGKLDAIHAILGLLQDDPPLTPDAIAEAVERFIEDATRVEAA